MNAIVDGGLADSCPATTRRSALKRRTAAVAAALALAGVCLPGAAQGQAISVPYLTGSWMDNAQCQGSGAMQFFPNGTFSSNGSIPVRYAVTGPSQFTVHGPGGAASMQAQYVNHNQMVVTVLNDSAVLFRCGGAHAPAMQHTQPTITFIIGGWTHNGNCARPEVFLGGGQFRTSQNATGSWSLVGNMLRMMPSNGVHGEFVVQANGRANMTLTQTSNGQVSYYTRCF